MKLKHLKIFKNFKKQTMSNEQFVVLVFDKMEKPLGTITGFSEKEISIFVESIKFIIFLKNDLCQKLT